MVRDPRSKPQGNNIDKLFFIINFFCFPKIEYYALISFIIEANCRLSGASSYPRFYCFRVLVKICVGSAMDLCCYITVSGIAKHVKNTFFCMYFSKLWVTQKQKLCQLKSNSKTTLKYILLPYYY